MFSGEDATDDTILTLIDEIILDPSNLAVKLNAMCILYHNLFGNLDQKLFASVIEINTKVCHFPMNRKSNIDDLVIILRREFMASRGISCLFLNF